ncbi:MAG: PKD domain-containing protein [Gammaproteobacteria bacterium]|nr:PKD domain-containing protein [Gammaproteobacteria bacterium]
MNTWRTNARSIVSETTIAISYLILAIFFFSACEQLPTGVDVNANAVWEEDTQTLLVSGIASSKVDTVQIHDAANGAVIGHASVDDEGYWSASSTVAACDVHVDLPEGMTTIPVQNAPANCSANSQGVRGRAIAATDIPNGVKVVANPVDLANIPNGVILSPPQDVTIAVGQSVDLQATVIGSAVVPPFSFRWDLAGVAPNSAVQNPGPLWFNTAGTYLIRLYVTDGAGNVDPTPALRSVTVTDPNTTLATTPTPTILSPVAVNGTVNINVGETLFFSGTATDDLNSQSFTFEWDFSGIFPPQFGATPGAVPFSRAGTYIVSLYATSTFGLRSPVPATVTVVVGAGVAAANQAPVGMITSPMNDVTINVGESLFFDATGYDPDNSGALYYSWEFERLAPNIYMSPVGAAGAVTFTTPGIFEIEMTVTDALGTKDPNPPKRRITVIDPFAGTPPVNGVLATTIISPQSDVTIRPGESVFFSGQASANNNPGLFQYFWTFGGAAANSNLPTPGNITFPIPGQFFVTFYVTDQTGNVVGNPATRTITVRAPSNVDASITSPTDNTSVTLGTPIFLMGEARNAQTVSNITYEWRIHRQDNDRDVFTSNQQSPGQYIFTDPGNYHVHLRVTGTDVLSGQQVSDRESVRVSVTGTPLPNLPPPGGGVNPIAANSGIVSPATDMVIYVGNEVNFQAINIPGANLNYNWNFGSVRGNSNRQSPGTVSFNTPGTFFVTLQVTGTSAGIPINIFDQRVITVMQQNPAFPPSPAPNPFPPFPGNPINGATAGIVSPAADTVVNLGSQIRFEAIDPPGANLNYNWEFAGLRNNSTRRSATVTFDRIGTFTIAVRISGTDAAGVPVNIFDQRNITVMQTNGALPPGASPFPPTLPPGFPAGQVPLGTGIVSPATDLVINVGDTVNFEANRLTGAIATYLWDFGAAARSSNDRRPDPVRFTTPGTYFVSLTVTGTLNGVPLNVFDRRVITVLQPSLPAPPVGQPNLPQPPAGLPFTGGGILTPSGDVVINVGDSVNFEANQINGNNINYQWNFGGAAAPSNFRNPQPVQFTTPGTFFVTLQITGSINGAPVNVFDQRVVTVQQGFQSPIANPFPTPPIGAPIGGAPIGGSPFPPVAGVSGPEGYIVSPSSSFVQIRVGQSLQFSGMGFDPSGAGQLIFQWSFGGAARNIETQNPGTISFNQVGTFVVTLLVRNAFGQYDTTPPSVVVQVSP